MHKTSIAFRPTADFVPIASWLVVVNPLSALPIGFALFPAHAAYRKAAELFDIKLVQAPLGPDYR